MADLNLEGCGKSWRNCGNIECQIGEKCVQKEKLANIFIEISGDIVCTRPNIERCTKYGINACSNGCRDQLASPKPTSEIIIPISEILPAEFLEA